MSEVRKEVFICDPETDERILVKALFDTGSTISVIHEEIANKFNSWTLYKDPEFIGQAFHKDKGKLIGSKELLLDIDGCKTSTRHLYKISPDLMEQCVIGVDNMEKFDIKIDPGTTAGRKRNAKFRKCPPPIPKLGIIRPLPAAKP